MTPPRAYPFGAAGRRWLGTRYSPRDLAVVARYCRMRGLCPWRHRPDLFDERLCLLLFRLSVRARHPAEKIPRLALAFSRAGTTCSAWVNSPSAGRL
jgi:hypothetical protein